MAVLRAAGRGAAALATIGLLTVFFYRLVPVNSTTVALSFLLAILAIAALWGLTEAILASVGGMLAFNYFFLPPVGAFTVADPQNWVALFAFLTTAVVASQLSSSAKRRASEAEQRQQEMEKLYALSRAFMLQGGEDSFAGVGGESGVASLMPYHVAQVFGLPAVALYERSNDRVFRAGPDELGVVDNKLRDAALQNTEWQDPQSGVRVIPVSLGGMPLASLAVPAGLVSDAALHAIANLSAIILERSRTQEMAIRAEAARYNAQLKSTLLDALAHEFKTPLTSIKAAVSTVLEERGAPSRELLEIVEQESDRLTSLVTETIQMARIEAGNIRLELQPLHPADLIAGALNKMSAPVIDREIRVEASDPALPDVLADREMISLVIRQLVGNSLKFAPPESPVTIRARVWEDAVTFSVADSGPGIAEREQARIFEKFYRIREHATLVPGSGMGLPIAKEIVEAHGGRIWVRSRPGEGSEFFFTLPTAKLAAPAVASHAPAGGSRA
jgi:two-component system, OmpR family, sensor histidine kinase KdpD